MGLKINNPFIKGNFKDFIKGTSGGRIGSPNRVLHRMTGTKEERKMQTRRLGGALAGAVGGFIKGGPWGAGAGAIMGAQSKKPLTLQRTLEEGGKGFVAGVGVGGIQGMMAKGGQASALGAGRGLTSSGGASMADQGGSSLGSSSGGMTFLRNNITKLAKNNMSGGGQQQQAPAENTYYEKMITDAFQRMREARQRKIFEGGGK